MTPPRALIRFACAALAASVVACASPHYSPHVGQAAQVDPVPEELYDPDATKWLSPSAMQSHVYNALASVTQVLPVGGGSFGVTHFRDVPDERRRFPWIHAGEWQTSLSSTPPDRLAALSAAGVAPDVVERLAARRLVVRYWTEIGAPARPPGRLYMEVRVLAASPTDAAPEVVEPPELERLMAADFIAKVGARWE